MPTLANLYAADDTPPQGASALQKATSIGPSPEPEGGDLFSKFRRNVTWQHAPNEPEQEDVPPGDTNDPAYRLSQAVMWLHDTDQHASDWVREHPWSALVTFGSIYGIGRQVMRSLAVKAAEEGAKRGLGALAARRATGAIGEEVTRTAAKRAAGRAAMHELGDETWRHTTSHVVKKGTASNPLRWLLSNKYELKDIVEAVANVVGKP